MNAIEHLEHVIGLIGKAPDAEIKGKLIAIRDEVAAHVAAAAQYAELLEKYTALQKTQSKKEPELVPYYGVLWKRAGRGFEAIPYCPQCANHPVMFGNPPDGPEIWQCSVCGFVASYHSAPVA